MKPLLCLIIIAIASCIPTYHRKRVSGYRPLYSNNIADLHVTYNEPRAMKHAGKIYVKDNYIFQLDEINGIHVYDKSIPDQVKVIGFLEIKGASAMAISGNNLITNASADLITVDIADIRHPKVLSRIPHAFAKGFTYYDPESLPVSPPEHGVYYVCPDPAAGILAGWKKDSIDAYCYYP